MIPASSHVLDGREDILRNAKALLGVTSSDIEEGSVSPTSTTARTLAEWASDPELLRTPETLVPGLAIEGRATLLSGREKIGKSTLVAGAVAAASNAQEVFGVAVKEPIRSLLYTNDEPLADTVRRLTRLGANPDGILINDAPRTFAELSAAIERDLAVFTDVGNIVVDTLSRLFAVSGVDPNSSREVEPAIANLVDLLHRNNVSGILIYHTGKNGREYRGSTALGATVDEVLTLRRRGTDEDDFDEDGTDDGRRILVQDGRNLRGRIQLEFRDGAYVIYNETREPQDRILDTLRDHGTVFGRAELTKLAKLRRETGLRLIREMIGSGLIVERGKALTLSSTSSLSSALRNRGGTDSGTSFEIGSRL